MAAADDGVPTRTARRPGDPRPDEVIERNDVSNAASSDFAATLTLSESQLERA